MKLLLLGGTRFLGRAIAVEALARGMEVTCLARGTSAPPDGVTFVRADRNDDIALSPVSQQHWDAVIDVSMQPGQVRRAVRDLSTDHVVIISTSSVYATGDRLEQDEDAPILAALDGDIMTDMSTYGPAKVACEEAVRASTVTSTIIRSGLIGGPGDTSGRSGYYPWRFAHPTGEDVLVPRPRLPLRAHRRGRPCCVGGHRCAEPHRRDVQRHRSHDAAGERPGDCSASPASKRPRHNPSPWRSCAQRASSPGWGRSRCRCGSTIRRIATAPRRTRAPRGRSA